MIFTSIYTISQPPQPNHGVTEFWMLVLLEVHLTLGDVLLDTDWELEAVYLLLLGEAGQDGSPAPVLQWNEVPLQDPQRHFFLGGSAAHYGVEGLTNFLEATESHPETSVVLLEAKGSLETVKEHPSPLWPHSPGRALCTACACPHVRGDPCGWCPSCWYPHQAYSQRHPGGVSPSWC